METASNTLTDAIGQVLFQMTLINNTTNLNYVEMNDWELHIQEDKLLDWVRRK